jgi:hypothetical protein
MEVNQQQRREGNVVNGIQIFACYEIIFSNEKLSVRELKGIAEQIHFYPDEARNTFLRNVPLHIGMAELYNTYA